MEGHQLLPFGCAGIDGWNAEELSTIAASETAANDIWNVMARWELFSVVPTPLCNCKLVHIPKKEERILQAGQFRPIAIMSAFWRAWSSTWMRSDWVRGWSCKLFPTQCHRWNARSTRTRSHGCDHSSRVEQEEAWNHIRFPARIRHGGHQCYAGCL